MLELMVALIPYFFFLPLVLILISLPTHPASSPYLPSLAELKVLLKLRRSWKAGNRVVLPEPIPETLSRYGYRWYVRGLQKGLLLEYSKDEH